MELLDGTYINNNDDVFRKNLLRCNNISLNTTKNKKVICVNLLYLCVCVCGWGAGLYGEQEGENTYKIRTLHSIHL